MRDLAVDEEVEIDLGASPDVSVRVVRDRVDGDSAREHVEISNARPAEIQFELRLQLREGTRVVRADHSMGTKNGRPIFRLTIPAHAVQRCATRRSAPPVELQSHGLNYVGGGDCVRRRMKGVRYGESASTACTPSSRWPTQAPPRASTA